MYRFTPLMLSCFVLLSCSTGTKSNTPLADFLPDPEDLVAERFLLPTNAKPAQVLYQLQLGMTEAGRTFLTNRNSSILSNSYSFFARSRKHKIRAANELNGITRTNEVIYSTLTCEREIVSHNGKLAFLQITCRGGETESLPDSPEFRHDQWSKDENSISYEFSDSLIVRQAQMDLYQNLGKPETERAHPGPGTDFDLLMRPGANGVYGFGCGLSGADRPAKSVAIEKLIEAQNLSALSHILRSISPTSRVYAAYGLFRLQHQGISIPENDLILLSQMLQSDIYIPMCSGCITTTIEMSELMKAAYRDAQFHAQVKAQKPIE